MLYVRVWLARHPPVLRWELRCSEYSKHYAGRCVRGLKPTDICQKLRKYFVWPGEGKKKYALFFLQCLLKKIA